MFGIHILDSDTYHQLLAKAEAFGTTEAGKVLAALRADPGVGGAAVKAVTDAFAQNVPGLQKLENVVADIAPVITEFLTGKGWTGVLADVEGIARGLGQMVYLDIKGTSAGGIIGDVAKLLKL